MDGMAVSNKAKNAKEKKTAGPIRFVREVKAEVKRITWPTKEDAKKSFLTVITFVLICLVLVGGLDTIFKSLFDLVINLK